jgi:hypothetical protein
MGKIIFIIIYVVMWSAFGIFFLIKKRKEKKKIKLKKEKLIKEADFLQHIVDNFDLVRYYDNSFFYFENHTIHLVEYKNSLTIYIDKQVTNQMFMEGFDIDEYGNFNKNNNLHYSDMLNHSEFLYDFSEEYHIIRKKRYELILKLNKYMKDPILFERKRKLKKIKR